MLQALLMLGLSAAPADAGAFDRIKLVTEVEDEAARAVATSVEAYVIDRVRDAWGIESNSGVGAESRGRQFDISLIWERPEEVTIRISEGMDILVARPVEVGDPDAARALVWLLVRSTIERVVLRDDEGAQVGSIPAVAPSLPGVSSETGDVADVELVSDADIEPLIEEPEPEPPEPEVPATDAVALSVPQAELEDNAESEESSEATEPEVRAQSEAKPKRRLDADVISAGVAARAYADSASGLASGPALQLRLRLQHWLYVGLELGFRTETREVFRTGNAGQGLDTFEIQHVPLTLSGGVQPLRNLPVEFGAALTIDMRRLTTVENTGTTVGIMLGGYSRIFWDFWTSDRNSIALFGDLMLSVPAVRQAYVVGDSREEDGLLVFGAGAGLEWRWH